MVNMDKDDSALVFGCALVILIFIGIIIASGIFLYNVDRKLNAIIKRECSCKNHPSE